MHNLLYHSKEKEILEIASYDPFNAFVFSIGIYIYVCMYVYIYCILYLINAVFQKQKCKTSTTNVVFEK